MLFLSIVGLFLKKVSKREGAFKNPANKGLFGCILWNLEIQRQ